MSNIQTVDGSCRLRFLKAQGAGSKTDPYIPEYLEVNSDEIRSLLTDILDEMLAPDDLLVAAGVRDATVGLGSPVIAAVAGKRAEFHQVKLQRIEEDGEQVVTWEAGATVLDPCLLRMNANHSAIIQNYGGRLRGPAGSATYLRTSTATTFNYWILYRLID